MIRVKGSLLETSYVVFRHPDAHRVSYLSCIHLGVTGYFKELQQVIDAWGGVIFEEFLTGDDRWSKVIPKEKVGIQFKWPELHKLQRMRSQRRVLNYPVTRTVSVDISWPEHIRLYDTVLTLLPFSERYFKLVMRALESHPREAYAVLWYAFVTCLKAFGGPPEDASYREEMITQKSRFRPVREHIESLPQCTQRLLKLYRVIEHIYLHEPATSFVPERDTAVLRGIDLERCGQKRDVLLVYGGGHYRGIARGLYDRGYAKEEEAWLRVCDFPSIDLKEFTEALITISKLT